MCGICGIYNHSSSQSGIVDDQVLVQMRDSMVHRGPDDCGIFANPSRGLGFGFRRLSIIDLSPAGHQPMCNEDGSVWIVFNGEIYNHAELRPVLEKKGHAYRSRTDTETILHLYEEHGTDCVLYLRGMFSFAIWDERKQQLFLARDRIGIKPLYYAQCNGVFLFASEIKALLRYPGLAPRLSEEALYHFLTFMIPPAPLTMFEGIYKLSPGHRLVVDRNGPGQPERYWDPLSATCPLALNEAEYIERIRELLDESVRLRMMSDVPFGAFLSGGIDSSLVVALMARHSNLPVNTFTVGYRDAPELNELQYARQIVTEFGANHHEVMIDGQDMMDYMPQLVHTQDEPIGDPVCVPLYYVSKLAHDNGVTVIQVGEGSDELFCGYPWYLTYIDEYNLQRRLASMTPELLVGGLHWGAKWATRISGRGAGWTDRLDRWRRHERPFWGGAVVYRGEQKETLLNTGRWRGLALDSGAVAERHYRHALAMRPDMDILGQMTYLELNHRLPELLLMRVDKVTMSTSLEARVPFLDHHLVEFALQIPMTAKIKDQPKHLLKKAAEGIIPHNLIYRQKRGFPAPVKAWFDTISAKHLRQVLTEGTLSREGYCDLDFVARMLSEQLSGSRDWSTKLWVLYNVNLWFMHWFEAKAAA